MGTCCSSAWSPSSSDDGKPNLPTPQAQTESESQSARVGLVVDCGSGHASVFWYTAEATGTIRQVRRSRLQVSGSKTQFKLADELSNSGSKLEDAISRTCDLLVAEMETAAAEAASGLTPSVLFVGATGGLREALATGDVQMSALELLTTRLQSRFTHIERVRFLCLSGEQEAAWELAAARAIWGAGARDMFSAVDSAGEALNPRVASFGLFSGGGQSMQLAGMVANLESLSWPFSTWSDAMDERKGAAQEAWREAGGPWATWEAELLKNIAAEKVRLAAAWPLRGCCVLTAMNEVAAKAAGFGEASIDVGTAVTKCRSTLADFRSGTGEAFGAFIEKRKHYKYNVARCASSDGMQASQILW